MDSAESLFVELKALTPDGLDRVARLVHELYAGQNGNELPPDSAQIPESTVERAVRNGWPARLFTHVIGQPGTEIERQHQLTFENRRGFE